MYNGNTIEEITSFLRADDTILEHDEAYEELKTKYHQILKLSSFTPKIRCFLIVLIGCRRYSSLKQEEKSKITNFDKSAVPRIINEFQRTPPETKTKSKGRPQILTENRCSIKFEMVSKHNK